MRIVYDEPLRPGWVVTKIRSPQLSAAFFVKGTFRLRANAPAVPAEEPEPPTGDVHYGDDPEKSLRYASDFAPFKPNTDLLFSGTYHAPGGTPVSVSSVSVRAGNWSKSLGVIGNRTVRRGRASDPEPFRSMAVAHDRAYGGLGFERNPFGVGHREETAPDGARLRRLPNIVYPKDLSADPDRRLEPAGLGPLPETVPDRMGKAGTYDKTWLKKSWPWLPDDFDWSYFNAAPKDQQLPRFLQGDEELCFENLHPVHARFVAKLPGIRARCFLHERVDGTMRFREVPLKLDTLWAEPDSEKLILVWRGHVEVRTLKLKELEHLYLAVEPLKGEHQTPERHREILLSRLPQKYEYVPPAKAPEPAPEKEIEDVSKELAQMETEAAKVQADVKARIMAMGKDAGIDSKEMFPKADAGIPAPTQPQEIVAGYAKGLAGFREQFASIPEIGASLEGVQIPDVAPEEPPSEEPPEPPPWTRESVREGVARGADFAKEDLSGLDLSGLDLSGAKFGLARLGGAKLAKTKLVGASLREAYLRKADLAEADLTDADLEETDFTGATLVKARLVRARLRWVECEEANLEAADLSESGGKGAGFSKANLTKARFRSAKLPVADFTEAQLADADFSGAELQGARFEEAKGAGVVMERADLSRLHAGEGPDFTDGNFREAKAAESFWEGAQLDGADFSKAILTRADFTDGSLKNARFLRAEMSKARFVDASLVGAQIAQSNVCRGSFERADLTGADLTGSNFYNAEFWDAVTEGTRWVGANLQGTKLA